MNSEIVVEEKSDVSNESVARNLVHPENRFQAVITRLNSERMSECRRLTEENGEYNHTLSRSDIIYLSEWDSAAREMTFQRFGSCHRRLLVWIKRYFPRIIPIVVIKYYYTMDIETRYELTEGQFNGVIDCLRIASFEESHRNEYDYFLAFCDVIDKNTGKLSTRHFVYNGRVFARMWNNNISNFSSLYDGMLLYWGKLNEDIPSVCDPCCMCTWCCYYRTDFENMRIYLCET